jgi:DNA-binding transcriptional LysR family regulator
MNDRFFSLQLFARVARTGSFSIAAREFGISQPTASRVVAALEKMIGVALLTRSTRAVTLTEAGADYLIRTEAILAQLDEADHAARGTGELRGLLRIALSPSFAVRTLMPILSRFADDHPALRLEFNLHDHRQDLVGDAVDVAVRIGTLNDSSLVAKKIGVNPRVLVASPDYLKRYGRPNVPGDLVNHTVVVGPAGRGMEGWSFSKDGKTTSVRVDGRYIINAAEGATSAAVNGLGIASCGFMGVMAELRAGQLVRVLDDWEMGQVDVNIILPAGKATKPSARAFTDWLAKEVQSQEADWQATPGAPPFKR